MVRDPIVQQPDLGATCVSGCVAANDYAKWWLTCDFSIVDSQQAKPLDI
jgi:hypothetical protein